ncbi:MAG: response regulator transcription factor [Bacteroidia bacterium]
MIRCLIVDDEPLARDVIKGFVQDAPNLELVTECENAIEAINTLSTEQIDLMFLDINMPKLSGIEMLKGLSNAPATIITTAHPEFALEGYELSVVDYLMKPISFSRFLKAIGKVEEKAKEDEKIITLKADKRVYRLNASEISYVEGLGDYVKVFLADSEKPLIVQETMKKLLQDLGSDFMRIHKSFIINKQVISYQEGNELVLYSGSKIAVGHSYRKEVSAFMLGKK